ncbi:hypothetical protein HPDP_00997 [Candidatus Hepatincola sp. Pdp]
MQKNHKKENTTTACSTDFSVCWEAILEKLKVDLVRPILNSQIGRVIVNLDKNKQDLTFWNDGTFEYILCNGAKIDANTHPELAVIYGEYVPDFSTGATIRHIPEGDTRILGDFQADDIKAHTHSMPDLTGDFNSLVKLNDYLANGVFANSINRGGGGPDGGDHPSASEGTRLTFEKKDWNTNSFGSSETRMKNLAVQFYVISKILI